MDRSERRGAFQEAPPQGNVSAAIVERWIKCVQVCVCACVRARAPVCILYRHAKLQCQHCSQSFEAHVWFKSAGTAPPFKDVLIALCYFPRMIFTHARPPSFLNHLIWWRTLVILVNLNQLLLSAPVPPCSRRRGERRGVVVVGGRG